MACPSAFEGKTRPKAGLHFEGINFGRSARYRAGHVNGPPGILADRRTGPPVYVVRPGTRRAGQGLFRLARPVPGGPRKRSARGPPVDRPVPGGP